LNGSLERLDEIEISVNLLDLPAARITAGNVGAHGVLGRLVKIAGEQGFELGFIKAAHRLGSRCIARCEESYSRSIGADCLDR